MLKRSDNKYPVLEVMDDSETIKGRQQNDQEKVDTFVKYQRIPTKEESTTWSKEMFKYFRDQWKTKWNMECLELEDICDETTKVAKNMAENVINGQANDLFSKDHSLGEKLQC